MENDYVGNFDLFLPNDEFFVSSTRDLHKYIASARNKNTEKKTVVTAKCFEEYIVQKGFQKEKKIVDFTPAELDTLIGRWLVESKKKDGKEFEPDTLTSMHRALERYLQGNNYGKSILKDAEFETSRQVLAAQRKQLKGMGLGNKERKAESLTIDDEEMMWVNGGLGDENAETLQCSVWYLMSKSLGFRGCQEARQLCVGDLEFKKDEQSNDYIEWTEKTSKTRQGINGNTRPFNPKIFPDQENEQRCPVRLIKKYLSLRPACMRGPEAPFFLQINYNKTPADSVWYKAQPIGINTLGKFMKKIASKGGISEGRRITNHSVRKTTCSRLLHAGIPPTAVAQLSGHKNIQSLNSYNVLNFKQQQAMSKVLLNNNEPTCHLPGQQQLGERGSVTVALTSPPNVPAPSTSRQSSSTLSTCNDLNNRENESPVFNINNTGTGTIQIIYGQKPSNTQNSQVLNAIKSPEKKRRRILPLSFESDSD